MAGKFDEKPYRPKVTMHPYPVDFQVESDLDHTSPYPCGVCRQVFNSRWLLANHPHLPKASTR
jgi:hypothetical protein